MTLSISTPIDGSSLKPAPRAVACSLVGFALLIQAAPAQSEDAVVTVQAEVQTPLTLSKSQDMDFGWVAPAAGNVTMTYDITDGSLCATSGSLVRGGVCETAEFTGSGGSGERVRIRLPANRRVFLTGPGQRMRVNQMDIYETGGLTRRTRSGRRNQTFDINDPNGDFSFRVGGRLRVRANQAPGLYEGTFNVEVEYR